MAVHIHRRRFNDLTRSGFTLVELLVTVGIIAILLSVLLPVIRGAKLQAQSVHCGTQLRELFLAQAQYAADHRGRFTPIVQSTERWEHLLGPYLRKNGQAPRELMHCPSSPSRVEAGPGLLVRSTYGLNPAMQMINWKYRRDAKMDASRIILIADKADHAADDFLTTADGWFMLADDRIGQWWRFTDHNPHGALRHGGRQQGLCNAVMADGHVAAMTLQQLRRDSGHWYTGGIEGMPTSEVIGGCCP